HLLFAVQANGDAGAHGIAVGFLADQLYRQPVALRAHQIFEQCVTVSGCRYSDIQHATIPEIGNSHAAAIEQKIGSSAAPDFRESSIAIVAKMAIALPAMPRGAAEMFRVKKDSGFVIGLPANHVVEKVQLNFRAAVVVNPAVGGVDILPAVVIEIGERGSPEPAEWIGAGLPGNIFEGAVALVPQQRVTGSHILEHTYKSEAGLPENLEVERHVGLPHALAKRVHHVAVNRGAFGEPRFFRPDVRAINVQLALVVVVGERSAHPGTVGQRLTLDRDVGEGAVA